MLDIERSPALTHQKKKKEIKAKQKAHKPKNKPKKDTEHGTDDTYETESLFCFFIQQYGSFVQFPRNCYRKNNVEAIKQSLVCFGFLKF